MTERSDRDVSPALTVGEGDIDVSLRPRSLREFIGQPRVREQLQLVIEEPKPRRHTGSHSAVRSAGLGQDVVGDDHRRRAGVLAAGDVGAGVGTRR